MSFSFADLRDYGKSEFYDVTAWQFEDRGRELGASAVWFGQFGLAGWDGRAADGARASFTDVRRYLADAQTTTTTAASALDNFNTQMKSLHDQALALVQAAAAEGFSIADDGSIRDSYALSGLVASLSPADRAKYEELKTELPGRVADLLAQAAQTDQTVAAAITKAAALDPVAPLGPNPDLPAPPNTAPSVHNDHDYVTVDTGDGDDVVTVDQHGDDVAVTSNGVTRTYTGAQARNIIINSGNGNDTITVSPNVTMRLRLIAGDGSDTIENDGSGETYIQTGSGNDTVVGGFFRNTIYAGGGNDTITSRGKADYIDAGTGRSTVNAGSGDAIIVGDTGNNTINAGTGASKIYTGSGHTTVNNQGGNDVVYAQANSTVHGDPHGAGTNTVVTVNMTTIPDSIAVDGSPQFKERVLADLNFLAGSPHGQEMLANLAHTGHTITLVEGQHGNGGERPVHADGSAVPDSEVYYDPATGHRGTGSDAQIALDPGLMDMYDTGADSRTADPAKAYDFVEPSLVLFHELAHAYDTTHGVMWMDHYHGSDSADRTAGVANTEHEVVGLPVTVTPPGAIDSDTGQVYPEALIPDSIHPHDLTENALRQELGLPEREHYAG